MLEWLCGNIDSESGGVSSELLFVGRFFSELAQKVSWDNNFEESLTIPQDFVDNDRNARHQAYVIISPNAYANGPKVSTLAWSPSLDPELTSLNSQLSIVYK